MPYTHTKVGSTETLPGAHKGMKVSKILSEPQIFLATSHDRNSLIFMTLNNISMIFPWFYFKLGPFLKSHDNSMNSRVPRGCKPCQIILKKNYAKKHFPSSSSVLFSCLSSPFSKKGHFSSLFSLRGYPAYYHWFSKENLYCWTWKINRI